MIFNYASSHVLDIMSLCDNWISPPYNGFIFHKMLRTRTWIIHFLDHVQSPPGRYLRVMIQNNALQVKRSCHMPTRRKHAETSITKRNLCYNPYWRYQAFFVIEFCCLETMQQANQNFNMKKYKELCPLVPKFYHQLEHGYIISRQFSEGHNYSSVTQFQRQFTKSSWKITA